MFRVQLLVWWRQLNAIPQKISFKKHTFVILSLLISTLIGQEPNDVLMRHVPSEFARKKLTLTQMDGLPVLIRGDVQLSQAEMFQFAGIPEDDETRYTQLEAIYAKNHKLGYWLHSIARVSLFGTIILSLPNLKPATQLHEWLPAIEVTVFGAYTWVMAKRYQYRAQIARHDQVKLMGDLNLEQLVEDYNLRLYQQLVESGLTFSE